MKAVAESQKRAQSEAEKLQLAHAAAVHDCERLAGEILALQRSIQACKESRARLTTHDEELRREEAAALIELQSAMQSRNTVSFTHLGVAVDTIRSAIQALRMDIVANSIRIEEEEKELCGKRTDLCRKQQALEENQTVSDSLGDE